VQFGQLLGGTFDPFLLAGSVQLRCTSNTSRNGVTAVASAAAPMLTVLCLLLQAALQSDAACAMCYWALAYVQVGGAAQAPCQLYAASCTALLNSCESST
jgi:hypothetical protein